MQQVPLGRKAAVSCAVEKALPPIPGSVESNRKPQSASAPQGITEKKTDEHDLEEADLGLPRVAQMQRCEQDGEEKRSRPESDAGGQGKLNISAQQKFLEESH